MTTNLAGSPLFQPFAVGGLDLSNRIVMAPMTRGFSPNGVPGPDVAEYYARRARNDVGLIITEGTTIGHAVASSSTSVPRFHGSDALDGWAAVVAAVHREGGRVAPQLWHVGLDPLHWEEPDPARAMPSGAIPLSPSGTGPVRPAGRAMIENDISDVIEAFGAAAADARRIGFDAVELHGAHGYLIDQFMWQETNRRTDRYGGDAVARTRFAAEVIQACRRATGPDFPIIFRISQWKVGHYSARLSNTPEDLAAMLAPLVDAGVDIFHCSTRRFWHPEFAGSQHNLAGWVKTITGLPTITVGSVGLQDSDFLGYLEGKGAQPGGIDTLLERLATGEFDLVAVGRALLADPEWAAKVRSGDERGRHAFDADMLSRLA